MVATTDRKHVFNFARSMLHRAAAAGIMSPPRNRHALALYVLLSSLPGPVDAKKNASGRPAVVPDADLPASPDNRLLGGSRYHFRHKDRRGVCVYADVQRREDVVIKFLPRKQLNQRRAMHELRKLAMLGRHPFITEMKNLFETETHIGVVLEYAHAGNLEDLIKESAGSRLPEGLARWFFQQLVVGVEYSHMQGISNLDLKPRNLLLHTVKGLPLPVLKISDCGNSKYCDSSVGLCSSRVGDPLFMAPEVLANTDERRYNGLQADMWSAGVILYYMLFGAVPYTLPAPGQRPADLRLLLLFDQMTKLDSGLVVPKPASASLQDLLRGMLQPDARKRLTIDQVKSHPWFTVNLPEEVKTMNTTIRSKKLLRAQAKGKLVRREENNRPIAVAI